MRYKIETDGTKIWIRETQWMTKLCNGFFLDTPSGRDCLEQYIKTLYKVDARECRHMIRDRKIEYRAKPGAYGWEVARGTKLLFKA